MQESLGAPLLTPSGWPLHPRLVPKEVIPLITDNPKMATGEMREVLEQIRPHLVSAREIAEATGMHITNVRKLMASNGFPSPAIRHGRLVLFYDVDVAEYFALRRPGGGPVDTEADSKRRIERLSQLINPS